ncbi:CoA-acylating methylmalonate-semialdehyde dehydrogenase [candidate division KSB1 bacterium]
MEYSLYGHYIDGKHAGSKGKSIIDIVSPVDGGRIGQLSIGNSEDVNLAVESAQNAFLKWSQTDVRKRADILHNIRSLMKKHIDELAQLCTHENGKTVDESKAGIAKGIELIEFAASLPHTIGGPNLEVSDGIECKMVRVPLGVTASITPFNFPVMVPMWSIPLTIGCGNTFILKPSEQVPLSAFRLAELFSEAGLPDGVFNIVNGTQEVVEALCDHPDIQALSFVGSTRVAEIVYTRACANGKRALSLGGAKNHVVAMEDADIDITAHDVVNSSMGAAGQRCMAVHALICVGNADPLIDRVVGLAKKIRTGVDMGAIISQSSVERITGIIDDAEKAGAKVLLDGRHVRVKGKENGFYVGPTILDNVTPEMPCGCEEIFGPVLSIMRVGTMEEALAIENRNHYGNAASVFTSNGRTAREFELRSNAGMIGINIGIPVPREPFSFGGWNKSAFGPGDLTGTGGIEFWTKRKKITSKWFLKKARHWLD